MSVCVRVCACIYVSVFFVCECICYYDCMIIFSGMKIALEGPGFSTMKCRDGVIFIPINRECIFVKRVLHLKNVYKSYFGP